MTVEQEPSRHRTPATRRVSHDTAKHICHYLPGSLTRNRGDAIIGVIYSFFVIYLGYGAVDADLVPVQILDVRDTEGT